MKYSATELFSFLDYVASKGLMNRLTATARRTAATKILEAVDEQEKQDLRSLDRESAFARFVNLNKKSYTPESLQVYRSRFNSALDDFLKFADNPAAFRPVSGAPTRVKPDSNGARSVAKASGKPQRARTEVESGPLLALPAPDPMLEIPVPLSDGKIARLLLPRTLTKADAERLSALIAAYAVST